MAYNTTCLLHSICKPKRLLFFCVNTGYIVISWTLRPEPSVVRGPLHLKHGYICLPKSVVGSPFCMLALRPITPVLLRWVHCTTAFNRVCFLTVQQSGLLHNIWEISKLSHKTLSMRCNFSRGIGCEIKPENSSFWVENIGVAILRTATKNQGFLNRIQKCCHILGKMCSVYIKGTYTRCFNWILLLLLARSANRRLCRIC